MITSGPSGAMSSSQASVGSGSPGCSSASQPLRYAPAAPRAAASRRIACDDVVRVARGDRPDVDDPVGQRDGLHQRMAVCLNESRHDTAGTDVDGSGVGADKSGHVRPVAHGDDPAVGDGERLGCGPRVVDGQYGSGDDEVCISHVQES